MKKIKIEKKLKLKKETVATLTNRQLNNAKGGGTTVTQGNCATQDTKCGGACSQHASCG